MGDVNVTKLNKIGEDERGSTFDFSIRETGDFVLCNRKKLSQSGNTYHEGKSSRTNPKIFVLVSGNIEFSYRQIDSAEPKTITIDCPSIIEMELGQDGINSCSLSYEHSPDKTVNMLFGNMKFCVTNKLSLIDFSFEGINNR